MADYTYGSVLWMYSLMTLFVVGAVFFLVKAVRTGAVSGDEEPKFRMLADDAPAGAGDGARRRTT